MTFPTPASGEPELASVRLSKQLLRQASRSRRRATSDEARAEANRSRSRLVWNFLSPTARVAMYLSRTPEPDTLGLARALVERQRPVLVPILAGGADAPAWGLLRSMDEVSPGPRGIPAISGAPLAEDALSHADVILVSGLAGTLDGGRLGEGGGWFDRALVHAGADAEVILMLNEAEICAELPLERHDRRVRHIATEERLITCW